MDPTVETTRRLINLFNKTEDAEDKEALKDAIGYMFIAMENGECDQEDDFTNAERGFFA